MLSDEEKKAIESFKEENNNDLSRFDDFNSYTQFKVKRDKIIIDLIEKQSKEIEELKDFIVKLQATKDRLDGYDKENTLEIEKLKKEIEELKEENKEIREWKYVIDNPIDLKKLSELDIIKIFGKSYIAKDLIKAKIELRLKELDEQMKKEWKEYGNSREYQDMEDEWNFLQSLLEKE